VAAATVVATVEERAVEGRAVGDGVDMMVEVVGPGVEGTVAAMVAAATVVATVEERAVEGRAVGDGVDMMVEVVGPGVEGTVVAMQDNKSRRPSWPWSRSSPPRRPYNRESDIGT